MKLRLELDDGTVYEADGNQRTFNGIASKSAFQKQFGLPSLVLGLWSQVIGADGRPDLSGLPADQLAMLDEQHLAFLVWLELRRRRDDVPDGPWDSLVERIVDVEFASGSDEDPT